LKPIRFVPAISWFIFSLILLCLPGSTIPKYPWLAVIYADKWIHIFLFGMLYYLFARPFFSSKLKKTQQKKWFLLILVGGIAYGIIMEFVQKYWIPNRSFEVWDIVADSCGCLLGYVYCVGRLKKE
jgi:VanZ family protein